MTEPNEALVCDETERPTMALAPVDPRITFPSYVSFDEFIDVDSMLDYMRSMVSFLFRFAERL